MSSRDASTICIAMHKASFPVVKKIVATKTDFILKVMYVKLEKVQCDTRHSTHFKDSFHTALCNGVFFFFFIHFISFNFAIALRGACKSKDGIAPQKN